jgi:hypothetical protein
MNIANPNNLIVHKPSKVAGHSRAPLQEITYLELAARLLGTPAEELWDYHEGRDGISVRTSDGYRHRYTFKELESVEGAHQCAPAGSFSQGCHAR